MNKQKLSYKKKGAILLISFVSLSLLLTTSCRPKNAFDHTKTLNLPLPGEISTIDPVNAYDSISSKIVYQCYEQLYQYDYMRRPYKIEPLLADGMPKIINDTTYIIKIKKNIFYHKHPALKANRMVTAQDFITQIKRIAYKKNKSNGWWIFDNKIQGINDFKEKATNFKKFKAMSISGVKALDDYTLKIKLNKAYPQMLYILTMAFVSPIPIEILEYNPHELVRREVGTGPFYIKSWNRLSGVKFNKFSRYRQEVYPSTGDRFSHEHHYLKDANKPLPLSSEINYIVLKQPQTRWLNFLNNKIDFIILPKDSYISSIDKQGNLKKFLQEKGIKLLKSPSLTFWWISFNMNDPILKNKLIRQAIALSINRDKFISLFTNNTGLKANSIFPPGIPGYDPSYTFPYQYNLKKAKQLLVQAGFPAGKGLPELRFDTRSDDTTRRQHAFFFKSQLSKIGIKMKIITNTFPLFLTKAKKGKLQIWEDGWSMDYPDSENLLQLLRSQNFAPTGPNITFYKNKRFDLLFDKLSQKSAFSFSKFQLMKKINKIIINDLPWVMLYYSRDYILFYDNLLNFRHSDIIYNELKYLRKK